MPLPADPLKWAITAFKDGRNDDYARYERYLAGDQPLAFATEKFRSAFGRQLDAFAYNRCESVVDAHADRLQVAGFGADDPDLSHRAQRLWDANSMDVRYGHLEVDAFGLGDSYLIVEKHPVSGNVHMWVQSPANVRVHYSDDVPGVLDLAAKTWQTDEKYQRLNLYFAGRIQKYISSNRAPSGVPVSATAFVRYDHADEPWEFDLNVPDIVPVFPFANNGRTNGYGRSELRHVLPLQDALNKTVGDTLVAMEFAAYPQRVMTGVSSPETDEEKAILQRFEAGISKIFTIEDPNGKIATYPAVNIAQYLAVAEFFDTAISHVTKVPKHYLSLAGDIPSGAALRIFETPFVKKLEDRQKAFGPQIGAATEYGIRLEDGSTIAPGSIRTNWTPAAPLSDEEVWGLITTKRQAGMAFESALREAGYDPDQLTLLQRESDRALARAERMFDAEAVVAEMSRLDERKENAA